jgi:hypothetical protein
VARKITDGAVIGLRHQLAAKCRTTLARLEHSTQAELYDFSVELDRLRDRLIDIMAGRDVFVYRFEIPHYMQTLRTDGQMVYTLRGDTLMAAAYERVDQF